MNMASTATRTGSAIRVDDAEITDHMIAAEMQHHPAGTRDEAWRMASEALVVRALLLSEARRVGILCGADDIADDPAIAALIERDVHCPEPDEETCRRYFERNRSRFNHPDSFDARHILLASPQDDAAARAAGISTAAGIISDLQENPGLFDELALRYSSCPSREQGGRLGSVSRGDTVPEFETYLFSLKPGELCPVPVQTRYGVHVLRLDDRIPGGAVAFEDVSGKIAQFLKGRSLQTALGQYISILAGRARIQGIELPVSHWGITSADHPGGA